MRLLARFFEADKRTVLGKTLETLCRLCRARYPSDPTSQCVKANLRYCQTPAAESWRGNMTTELLNLRRDNLSLSGFSSEELQAILDYVCTSYLSDF